MASFVIMPRQGQSVESCIITKWHKKEGDAVKAGDLLFTYETDKSTFDEEAKEDGVLLKILHGEDCDVPCLENVCIIGTKGEKVDALAFETAKPQAAEAKVEKIEEKPVQIISTKTENADFVKISPRAKKLAEKLDIDFSLAIPTGAEGRIMERDIDRLAKEGVPASATPVVQAVEKVETAPAADYVEEKLSNIRKVIAKQMLLSMTTTAQLTHTASFDATEILDFRAKIKPKAEKGEIPNITLNDIILFAVSRVLTNHRLLNAHMLDDKMRFFNVVNLGMAADTPRGLMVPTIFNAHKMSLSEISVAANKVAKEAQAGTISPDKLSGGTFTISNLGVFGVESFTPILNAPQTGILGVNTITKRVKEVNGQIALYPCMTLSLTYDHRALDGAAASKFLQEICKTLENFVVTLI